MNFTNVNDVTNQLYSLPHLHPKNDLSYIKRILAVLDNPQDKIKTIHVTGTNGKGSTCYYLSNLLKKAGLKTGLFVSPYIREFNERIQLNGQNISDQELVDVANQVEWAISKIQKHDPTFSLVTFEYEVAMAFIYFAKEKCDYAVIEVGIGAEHDKTNVIMPQLSIITTIGLDHEKIIGPTLQDIAQEKSGIIKNKRPIVLGDIPIEVLPIIMHRAQKMHAPVYQLNRDFSVKQKKQINYSFGKEKLRFALRPKVEVNDISLALTAFFILEIKLPARDIETTINETNIPGRYQILNMNPAIIIDGAHNIQAMKNLLDYSHQIQKNKNGKLKVLIAMMKDKDISKVFSLFNNQDEVTLTTINYPRAAKLVDFPVEVQQKYNYIDKWQVAYQNLKRDLSENDILLITGSFYLVSRVLNLER